MEVGAQEIGDNQEIDQEEELGDQNEEDQEEDEENEEEEDEEDEEDGPARIEYNTKLGKLEKLLEKLRTSSQFYSTGVRQLAMPTITIEGIGRLSFRFSRFRRRGWLRRPRGLLSAAVRRPSRI